MPLHYLLGPAAPARAREWQHHRDQGRCLCFNAGGKADVPVGFSDTCDQLLARLPECWRPDFVALDLSYTTVPAWLFAAPVPLVALAPDWQLQWHFLRRAAPLCQLVLTDRAGVAALRREGVHHALEANLFGLQGLFAQAAPAGPAVRDIDVLFVGNLHPAVQRERLAWLGRLARLGGRYRVHVAQGVHGEDYRRLLLRSRVVFNRSARGEWNLRVGEACSCGALLFCEADNLEMPALWPDREECVFYDDDNLEPLLEHYLSHEAERRQVAERGRAKVRSFTFAALWDAALAQVESQLPALRDRLRLRPAVPAADALTARVWQALGAADAGDPTLAADLLSGPPSPLRGGGGGEGFRLNALGVVEALAGRDPRAAARCFQQAALAGGVVAALNVVEALAVLGEKSLAAEGARKLLARLLGGGLPPRELDQPHYPPGYTLFRVEWERAAWQSAGRPRDEARAKLRLVRWRLHSLLAELTGELPHHHEAAVERPDLPPTRAALGCALGAAGRPAEAAAHLHAASLANPFDRAAARALYQSLLDAGQTAQADALARDRLLLRLSAPAAVAAEDWALQPRRGNAPANPTSPLALVWEGAFLAQHSLGLLNRALCHRLMHRGHELSLTPIPSPGPQIEPGPDRDRLAARFAHPLSRPEDACVRLGWPPRWQAPAHGKWVVVQPWEYGSLPRDWLAPLRQQVDEVWVPTAFVRDGFVQSGVPADRVHVVPCGVDAAAFRPGLDPRPLPTTRRFRFLFVGGTIHRKGVDVLLAAYARAFRASDDVCLVVKDMGVGSFYAGQTAENRVGAFRADAGNPEVVYLDDSLTEAEMARLYNACDCLVHPYRGEGFGLPILEAMACGVPVVVTGYGAALDFCDEATAALIPAKVVPFPENKVGDIPTVGRPWLAEPDEEALADLLRRAVEHPREARQRAALARQRVLGGFTWDHAARTAEGRLLALREAPQLRQPARRAAPFLPPSPSASGGEGPGVRGVFPGASTCQPITAKASLCLIVKNEEDNIAACLQSAAGLFDDVVVVDTGSADRTKQIALGHGARVFDFPWVDDFAAARNETLRHAKGEWIFWLDADDRLDEDNREKLRLLLQRLPEHNVCFSVKCRCLSDPASDASTVVDHIRLFRNDPRIAWRYRIHEQILPSIREAGGRVEHADVEVLHTGYADAALRRRKLERDLRLLLLEHAAQPHDPFTLFNLGASYAELRRHDEALPLLQESLARSHPSDSIVRKLYALIASCHLTTGRHAEALAVCSQGLAVCPDDQELLFLEALIRTGQDDLHTAKAVLLRLLAAEPGKHFASVVDGLRGHKGRHQLALVCFRLGEFCEAEPLWQAVLRDRPGFLPARVGLAELYLHQERWPDLEATLAALEQSPPGAAEAALLRGKAHLARREFAAARSLLEAERARRPDCLAVLTTLSHVLLQEDRDHAAAEGLLCDILAHDPGHAQARQNLLALRRRTAAG